MNDSDLIAAFERIDKRLDAIDKKLAQRSGGGRGGEVADDADLDGRFGNEEIRRMPSAKYWEGEDFTGFTMSNTNPEFLDAYAKYKSACSFMTRKNGDPEKLKYADYDDRSAARARGWAKRLREGWTAPGPKSDAKWDDNNNGDDSELPF